MGNNAKNGFLPNKTLTLKGNKAKNISFLADMANSVKRREDKRREEKRREKKRRREEEGRKKKKKIRKNKGMKTMCMKLCM